MSSVRRALPVAVAVGLMLSGCGGGEPAGPPQSSGAHGSPPGRSATGGASGAAGAAADPARRVRTAALSGLQPAAGDLSNFSCEQRRTVWSAGGAITNSAREPMVYTVTVVTLSGNEVAGHESDEVLLDPGESTTFDFSAVSRGDADACMPRVVRAPR